MSEKIRIRRIVKGSMQDLLRTYFVVFAFALLVIVVLVVAQVCRFLIPQTYLFRDAKAKEFVYIVKADIPDDPAKLLFSREVFSPLHKLPEIVAQDPSVHLMSGI